MSSERSLALPVAIVMGSAMIGIALYFGLRDGLASRATAPAPAVQAPVAAPPAVPAPAATPAPPAPQGEPVPDRVYRQAQAALDVLRPGIVKTCWTPPAAGEPAAILLTYDVTFGADGGILALGISEQREAFRTSVAECVRRQPRPELRVDPPGQSVRVILGLPMP